MTTDALATIKEMRRLHAEYVALCNLPSINLPLTNTNYHIKQARLCEQAYNAIPMLCDLAERQAARDAGEGADE